MKNLSDKLWTGLWVGYNFVVFGFLALIIRIESAIGLTIFFGINVYIIYKLGSAQGLKKYFADRRLQKQST